MRVFRQLYGGLRQIPGRVLRVRYMIVPSVMYNMYIWNRQVWGVDQEQENKKQYYAQIQQDELEQFLRENKNVSILPQYIVKKLISKLRDISTGSSDFRRTSDRVIRLLIEEYLGQEPTKIIIRQSPLAYYDSSELEYSDKDYCVVSIIRAGSSVLNEMIHIMPGITIGKILLQRNEQTYQPTFYYQKFPQNIQNKRIVVFDPMLATGGSIIMAIDHLVEIGCSPSNITFLNIFSSLPGISQLIQKYPDIKIITACIDKFILDDSKQIAPGVGNFGDRYYGTEIG